MTRTGRAHRIRAVARRRPEPIQPLGAHDAPTVKSAASLTQANLYTAPELAAASGVAHDAQLAWMLTIARTVRSLARVVSGTID